LALIFHLQSSLIYAKESERWTEEEMFVWTAIGPVCLDNKEDITRQQKSLQKHCNVPTSNNVKEEQAAVPKTTL